MLSVLGMRIDGRTLSKDTAETLRRMAVQRVWEGENPSDVIRSYGLCRTSIYPWLRIAERRGLAGLRAHRVPGRPSKLAPVHRARIRQWLNGHDPRRYGFESALWTRPIIVELISQRLGLVVDPTTVGRCLHSMGITPQKPLRRAYERDPVAIQAWLETVYPVLRSLSEMWGAKIFFLDESGVRSDQALGRTWGRRGHTPHVAVSGRRQSVNAISAINASGAFWYRTYTGRLNAPTFVAFLKAFLRGRHFPVWMITDSHPAHIAKAVATYVQSTMGRLELHFLPGYAPELNPDEFVWHHIKSQGISKSPLHDGESLRNRVDKDLDKLHHRPALIRSFFQAAGVD